MNKIQTIGGMGSGSGGGVSTISSPARSAPQISPSVIQKNSIGHFSNGFEQNSSFNHRGVSMNKIFSGKSPTEGTKILWQNPESQLKKAVNKPKTNEFKISLNVPKPESKHDLRPLAEKQDHQTAVSKRNPEISWIRDQVKESVKATPFSFQNQNVSINIPEAQPEFSVARPTETQTNLDPNRHSPRRYHALSRIKHQEREAFRQKVAEKKARNKTVQPTQMTFHQASYEPDIISKNPPVFSTQERIQDNVHPDQKINPDRRSATRYKRVFDNKKNQRDTFLASKAAKKNAHKAWSFITSKEHPRAAAKNQEVTKPQIIDQARSFLRHASVTDRQAARKAAMLENPQVQPEIKISQKIKVKPEVQTRPATVTHEQPITATVPEVTTSPTTKPITSPEVQPQTEVQPKVVVNENAPESVKKLVEANVTLVNQIVELMKETGTSEEEAEATETQLLEETIAKEGISEHVHVKTHQEVVQEGVVQIDQVGTPKKIETQMLDIETAYFIPDKVANSARKKTIRQQFLSLKKALKNRIGKITGKDLAAKMPSISISDEMNSGSTKGIKTDKSYDVMVHSIEKAGVIESDSDIDKIIDYNEDINPAIQMVTNPNDRVLGDQEISTVHNNENIFPSWLNGKKVRVFMFGRSNRRHSEFYRIRNRGEV